MVTYWLVRSITNLKDNDRNKRALVEAEIALSEILKIGSNFLHQSHIYSPGLNLGL
jgi:hypothetical protein